MPHQRQPQLPRPLTPPQRERIPNTISIPSSLLTREGVLAELEALGHDIKLLADPNHYPAEKRSWAKDFEPKLKACRTAWAAIHQNQDIEKTLSWLLKEMVTGSEYNRVNLIRIAATQGLGPHHWWTVENDRIVFQAKR